MNTVKLIEERLFIKFFLERHWGIDYIPNSLTLEPLNLITVKAHYMRFRLKAFCDMSYSLN